MEDPEKIMTTTNSLPKNKPEAEQGRPRPDVAGRLSIEAMFDAMPEALVAIDTAGLIQLWNQRAQEIFGWPADQVLGRPWPEVAIPEQYRQAHWRGLQNLLQNQPSVAPHPPLQLIAVRRLGNEFPIELTFSLLQTTDNTSLLVMFARDMTERKEARARVEESLEHRTRQVQLTTEVAQEIAAAPAVDKLFQQVVYLIQAQFGYYHVHVYTLEGADLVMQAGTGSAGKIMKEAGHKIPLNAEKSLVARAARSGRPVLAFDVRRMPDWLPNPLLPNTRAEVSIPIKLKQTVLGVLDVQNDAADSLGVEDQLLLMSLCGQIALFLAAKQETAHREAIEAERVRLLATAERRAGRERAIRNIIEKLRAAPTVDAALHIAAKELADHLTVSHAVIEVGIETE